MKNEYETPNKYRENPETDEMGVVKGTDPVGVVVASIAIAIALVGFLTAITLAIIS